MSKKSTPPLNKVPVTPKKPITVVNIRFESDSYKTNVKLSCSKKLPISYVILMLKSYLKQLETTYVKK